MVILAKEQVSTIADELLKLAELHWLEVSRHKNSISLAPDFAKYQELQDLGKLVLLTARESGELLGYCSALIDYHLHYKNNIFAVCDAIFVLKDRRGTLAGDKLIDAMKAEVKHLGADVFIIPVKLSNDFSSLLKRKGFSEVERLFEVKL